MGSMQTYIIKVQSENPIDLQLGCKVAGAEVIALEKEQLPKRVGTSWLLERFDISKQTMLDALRHFNKGSDSKHLYDPNEVIPVLENLNNKKRVGARRKA